MRPSSAAATNAIAISWGSPLCRARVTILSAASASAGSPRRRRRSRWTQRASMRLRTSPTLSARATIPSTSVSTSSARPHAASTVRCMTRTPKPTSAIPRPSLNSMASLQSLSATTGPRYCHVASARLLWRTAASRLMPCSIAMESAWRISSSPCSSPRYARAAPRNPNARGGGGMPREAANNSARSAAKMASVNSLST